MDLESQLAENEIEINAMELKIQKLRAKLATLQNKKDKIQNEILKQKSDKLSNLNWVREDHEWSKKLMTSLKDVFKIDKLRPYQLPTMNATLSNTDCILLMPTGGGKSLCFQLPALISKGVTLVVSPLVSLIEDQMIALKALNYPAEMLTSTVSKEIAKKVQTAMTDVKTPIKLIYVTPEKLAQSKRFMMAVQKMYNMGLFSRLVVDEVHCCSQWGHDFRKDYKFLGIMKRQFPKVPILGLTATATSDVITDVQKILNIEGCLVIKASFNRPNLFYQVLPKPSSASDATDELASLIKSRFKEKSGIIYCFSVKDSEDLAHELRKRGIRARPYHAQLEAARRSQIHADWRTNEIHVVVATVAFGMGIDKPDVRFVIHHTIPKSMENYYQESGRAGRDDKPADCILYYKLDDVFRISSMVFEDRVGLENLDSMLSYCLDIESCRRNIIARHFRENWEASQCNEMCDRCKHGVFKAKEINASGYMKVISKIISDFASKDERLTLQKLLKALNTKQYQNSLPKDIRIPERGLERIIGLFLLGHYLIKEFHFTPYSTICHIKQGPMATVDEPIIYKMPSGKRQLSLEFSDVPSVKKKKSDNNPTSIKDEVVILTDSE